MVSSFPLLLLLFPLPLEYPSDPDSRYKSFDVVLLATALLLLRRIARCVLGIAVALVLCYLFAFREESNNQDETSLLGLHDRFQNCAGNRSIRVSRSEYQTLETE